MGDGRGALTEEIAATPGWIDERLDEVFAILPSTDSVAAARAAYADCLARRKAPAAPSTMEGAEVEPCHQALLRALRQAGVEAPGLHGALEAMEAELAEES